MRIYIHLEPTSEYAEWTFVCKAPLTHVHEAVSAFADAYNRKFTAVTHRLCPTSLTVTLTNSKKPVDPNKKISTLLDEADSCELTLEPQTPQPVPTLSQPTTTHASADGTDLILAQAAKHKQNQAWRSAKALWEVVLADMDPVNVVAMQGMVDLYVQSSQWTKAKAWTAKMLPLVTTTAKAAVRLQSAKCDVRLKQYGQAVIILQELLSDPNLSPSAHHDATILLAHALYHGGQRKEQDVAISILVSMLQESNESDMDAMALYSEIAHDRGKPSEAIQMILKVLVDRPKDKRVQAACAAFLDAPNGFAYLRAALDPTGPSTAPAYAYLASVAKDHGAMNASIQCFQQAVAQCPRDVMFGLNYVHALEVCGRYADAYLFIKRYVDSNSTFAVGNTLTCSDVAAVLVPFATLDDARGPLSADASIQWKGTHVCVRENDFKFQRPVADKVDLTSEQLDLLAMLCTLVKILYLQGCLRPLPALLDVMEPVRFHYGHLLHTTSIRNEHAYYSCITQLVSIAPLCPDVPRTAKPIYVCGDSHALATAWRSVKVHSTERLLIPALVTGLKHCKR
ncbi:hypothetical protein, variant [Aphanomyces invadans]|uniref:Uncharacterized protein n=1 Tax=Aphanomyces invadans TaxID=157072 RepID=A0A024URV5_9STRA|nr:hypothetical protein, variant [Aphanomyces invadans]ETW08587.1 hypothetical protein, variant [Aphanomyces invadans]|eukprot:XP_008862392.1 hypothetical protein, variant [Aphanomyces invadans]